LARLISQGAATTDEQQAILNDLAAIADLDGNKQSAPDPESDAYDAIPAGKR